MAKKTKGFESIMVKRYKSFDGSLWDTPEKAEEVNVCTYIKDFVYSLFAEPDENSPDECDETLQHEAYEILDTIYKNLPELISILEKVKPYAKKIQKTYKV